MKNLKKVLSLVLVLVMVCGLCLTASASSFTDDADINYSDAVDVLSGLGILAGYTDGSFKPQGEVTRAAAAKMVAYLLLGKVAADNLSKNVSPFADVPAGHWAAGYIQYCANEGIINGVGDNKFNPNGNVTSAAYAKMLLVALGYGVNDEFVGSKWKSAVTKYAASAKLFAGNYAANPDAAANREEAALYTFNAMQASKVTYSALFGDYITSNALTGYEGTTFAKEYGLGEKVIGTVAYEKGVYSVDDVIGVDAAQEDIGRVVSVWYKNEGNKKVAITGVTYADTVLATKTDGTTIDNWTKAKTPGYVADADTTVTYIVNGVEDTYAAAKGDKVVILDTDGNKKIDRVIVTTYKYLTLTAAPTVKDGKVTITDIVNAAPANTVVGYENLAKGDVVYYTNNAATGVVTIAKAVSVVGSISAKSGATITLGGVTYTSRVAGDDVEAAMKAAASGIEYTLYLDASGKYAIKLVAPADVPVANNYAVLIDAVITTGAADIWSDSVATINAKILLPDGSVETVVAAEIAGASFKNNRLENGAETWYTYTVKDGKYTFKPVADTKSITKAISGVVNIGDGIKANGKTVYLVKNVAANGAVSYSVYTGFTNVPAMKDCNATAIVDKGVATLIYVSKTTPVDVVAKNYAYILDTDDVTIPGEKGAWIHTYAAIVDGKLDSIKSDEAIADIKVGLYEIEITNGKVTKLTDAKKPVIEIAEKTIVVADGVVTIAGTSYQYSAKTVVYIYNGTELTVGTLENVSNEYTKGSVTVIPNEKNAEIIDTLYIVL